jgi:hypothetical protein
MRIIIIKILLRLLGRINYRPLSEKEIDNLLTNIVKEEGLERFPDFLEQCADTYRNQFLYTKDERFRGAVLAFVVLRERLIEKKKNLTKPPKNGRIKGSY